MKWVCCLFVALLLSGCANGAETMAKVQVTPVPTITAEKVQPAVTEKPPYVGRFSVPSVGVDVACYYSAAQAVVDAADSAAYFDCSGHKVIADHVNQSFDGLKNCAVGDTAQVVGENGPEQYQCVAVSDGHNTGYDLTDENYVSIGELYPGTLVCYTCRNGWQNVTISFFEPIAAEPPTALEAMG